MSRKLPACLPKGGRFHFMRYQKGSFIVVPNKLALAGESAFVQCVFLWICSFADDEGICFPSIPTLARNAGCSDASVQRAILRLEELGFLSKRVRREGNKNLSNVYQICLVVSESDQGGLSDRPGWSPTDRVTISNITQSKELNSAPSAGNLDRPRSAPKRASQYRENQHADQAEQVIDAETGEPARNPAHTSLPSLEILRWAEARIGRKFPTYGKQMGSIARMFDAGYSGEQIRECWERLEKDTFWSSRGFDFGIVLNEIGKSRQESGGKTFTKYENGMRICYRDGKIISQEKLH